MTNFNVNARDVNITPSGYNIDIRFDVDSTEVLEDINADEIITYIINEDPIGVRDAILDELDEDEIINYISYEYVVSHFEDALYTNENIFSRVSYEEFRSYFSDCIDQEIQNALNERE